VAVVQTPDHGSPTKLLLGLLHGNSVRSPKRALMGRADMLLLIPQDETSTADAAWAKPQAGTFCSTIQTVSPTARCRSAFVQRQNASLIRT
jgi:hypothetical protein